MRERLSWLTPVNRLVCQKWLGVICVALAVLGPTVAEALAGTGQAYSEKGYYGPILGYDYVNESSIHNAGADGSWGQSSARTQDGKSPPTGWIGIHSTVYHSDGAFCIDTGDWVYTPEKASNITIYTLREIEKKCGPDNYYAQGESRAWAGTEYDTYYTFPTPDLGIGTA